MATRKLAAKQNFEKFYVIGIGASAGGLDAIQELFDNIPANTGFAYVIVQHLSPDHKSLLREILAKHTSMQLFEAQNEMQVAPDCVYIIPSRKTMTIENSRLILKDKDASRLPNNAIDIFFESLAGDYKNKAVGVILSGTGTDGTKGIEAIKSKGGIVLVQDPMTAAFDGMPNSAIATGCADMVLPPEMMADELIEYLRETPFVKSFSTLSKKDELILQDILELVRNETGHDFSMYKLTTLNRRLAKKMFEKGITTIADYYSHLLVNPQEVQELTKEFLINVTKFFRDTDAFEVLRTKVIPTIFEEKKPGDEIKIWVVACSTGEEAYSMAILVHEFLETHRYNNFNIKIFATDIDQDALAVATRGSYKEESLKDVSEERCRKFFVKDGNMYNVIPSVRKMVVFAKHDVTHDPPFSKIDLLSCRNMLIYMNGALQKNILKKFHFSLNENRFLFLGPSESPGTLMDYFREVDRKWKIYKCLLKIKTYDDDKYFSPVRDSGVHLGAAKSKNALNNIAEIFKDTLLSEYHFTGIFVDKDLEVKQAIGNFRNFMKFPEGDFNLNLQKLLPTDLSIAINTAVRKASKDHEQVVAKNVKIIEGNLQRNVNIIVRPYLQQQDYVQHFFFIIIEEVQKEKLKAKRSVQVTPVTSSERVAELEQELKEVRENLQSVIEEVESANEELQTSNEEIISSNEELQSTNEELQSLNEELHTVNAEHQSKIKELIELNDDLNNYFNNTDIGQILIDKRLTIRKFSPAATKHVNLIPSDIGRSISDISTNFKTTDLLKDVMAVMDSGKSLEKEILMENQKPCVLRIKPYMRQDKTTDGVVINFIDISDLKRLNSIIEAVFDNSPNAILALSTVKNSHKQVIDFEVTAANKNAADLFETPDELTGMYLVRDSLSISTHYQDFLRVVTNDSKLHVEYLDHKKNKWYEMIATKMMDGIIVTIGDIDDRKKTADMVRESYEKLKQASEELNITVEKLEQSNFNLVQFASVASHDLKEPLRKIQIFGNMLSEKISDKLEPMERNYLSKMINSSNRMQTLIDNVLAFSKLSSQGLEKVSSDINSIVQQILEDIEIAIKEKNAVINIGVLPTISAKAGQIRQLFQNLISNALKFTDKDNPVIHIKQVNPDPEEWEQLNHNIDKYVFIEVSDNGIGFDEKYSDKIFGLFQRLHGNNYQGTGLGLAICKKIVDEHDGYIKVNSKPGEGTRFVVALPK